MCNSPTTLHVFSTLAYQLQFNRLRNLHTHTVGRRMCLTHTHSSVLSVHLFFSVKRLPNCSCCSISASDSPSSAASRNLRSVSATSASLASSIAFFHLANSSGLLPQRTTRSILPSTLETHQRLTRLVTSTLVCLPSSSVTNLCCVGV